MLNMVVIGHSPWFIRGSDAARLAPGRRYGQGKVVRRLLSLLFVLGLALLLAGSGLLRPAEDFKPRQIALQARSFTPRGLTVTPPLRFIAGWTLSSDDPNFGGFSALAHKGGGFMALTDAANLIRFSLDRRNRARATIESLPKACWLRAARSSRDSESMVLDPSGRMWVGFEFTNRICRIDPKGGVRVLRPIPKSHWPIRRGAETMALLNDGRMIVIGEVRSRDKNGAYAPGLIFDGDPVDADTPVNRFGYRLRGAYRATDAATLPDGNLLVLERDHAGFYSFPGRLAIVMPQTIAAGKFVKSRKLVQLTAPDLDQNFEGVAVSQARGRTFVWLISDDNFVPVQRTMLLLFEYKP